MQYGEDLPGDSQGRGSLVGCRPWRRTESDMTEATWQCIYKGSGRGEKEGEGSRPGDRCQRVLGCL